MAKDPSYVRLTDRLIRGCQVDLRSGWSIAGLDVREFPDSDYPDAQQFVRGLLQRGVLEGASAAEFEEANGDTDHLAAAGVEITPPQIAGYYQEAHVVGKANEARRRLEASRGVGSHGLTYKDDQARKRAILKQQNGRQEDETADQTPQNRPGRPGASGDAGAGAAATPETATPPADEQKSGSAKK